MNDFLISSFIILGHLASMLSGQQQYSGQSVFACNSTDKTGPSPAILYSCNGQKHFCQAFLIFRSQPSYNSTTTISNLTSSAPQELSRINNISVSGIFPQNAEVIVPVHCSCSGQYYQANTSYLIQSEDDTYYTIAKDNYEGLATCDALKRANAYDALQLHSGLNLRVPLRCACPTKNQISKGIKFLLTYLVTSDDNIRNLSERFNVTSSSVADANGFSDEDPVLYPFTTILIPLPAAPLSSQIKGYSPESPPIARPPSTPSPRHKESRKGIYIGIAVGSSLGVLSCVLALLYLRSTGGNINKSWQKNKQRKEMQHSPEKIKQRISNFDQELKIYRFGEVEAATEGFCAGKKLSDSVSVYRGVLRGKLVAIKKMSRDVRKEVKMLQKINHFNLINLYGVCEHNDIYYLAYEFMENGSLRQWLNQKSPEVQRWNIRIRMALDIANGLDYLHSFTAPGYVHKDINSGNILVNGDLRAKIANFSFARSSRRGEIGDSVSSSTFVMGTKGYVAPEYLEAGMVTPKIDVYAFGVVLLELITGKEATFMENGSNVLLSEAALSIMSGTNAVADVGRLIHSDLQEKHPLGFIIDHSELALRLIKLSVACLATEPSRRLTMAAVVSSLLRIELDVQKPEYSFSLE